MKMAFSSPDPSPKKASSTATDAPDEVYLQALHGNTDNRSGQIVQVN
jgi:hypothetical protein